MDITGYVKNQLNGSVFVEAEGTAANLEAFIAQCKQGPGWAHVDRVDCEEFPTRGFKSFEVRY
jgi:acylphosphatase